MTDLNRAYAPFKCDGHPFVCLCDSATCELDVDAKVLSDREALMHIMARAQTAESKLATVLNRPAARLDCPKCGSEDTNYRYMNSNDMIERRCRRCGYEWRHDPISKESDNRE